MRFNLVLQLPDGSVHHGQLTKKLDRTYEAGDFVNLPTSGPGSGQVWRVIRVDQDATGPPTLVCDQSEL